MPSPACCSRVGDVPVPWAVPAAAAAVREEHHAQRVASGTVRRPGRASRSSPTSSSTSASEASPPLPAAVRRARRAAGPAEQLDDLAGPRSGGSPRRTGRWRGSAVAGPRSRTRRPRRRTGRRCRAARPAPPARPGPRRGRVPPGRPRGRSTRWRCRRRRPPLSGRPAGRGRGAPGRRGSAAAARPARAARPRRAPPRRRRWRRTIVGVDHPDPALTDGAHGELGLEGHAELADHDHVERGVQRTGHLEGHGDPAAREPEDDDVVRLEVPELLRRAVDRRRGGR